MIVFFLDRIFNMLYWVVDKLPNVNADLVTDLTNNTTSFVGYIEQADWFFPVNYFYTMLYVTAMLWTALFSIKFFQFLLDWILRIKG